jgi:ParB-like chromosome segregation protein Spo0J
LFEIGLTENLQRQDLAPLEEARALRTLIDERGYTIRRLAERIGKDKGYIQNRLVLLQAPPDVQEMLVHRPDTISVARDIGKVATAEARRPLIDGVVAGTLSREDVRALVRDDGVHPPGRVTPPSGSTQPAQRDRAGTKPPSVAPLDRALDRDIPVLRTIFARWRLAASDFNAPQRARVLAFIEEHRTELEHLTEVLRAH